MRQGASIDTAVRPANGEKVRAMRQDAPQSKPDSREGEAVSDMAVEVLKQQLADLTRDYTGACEAIRQLEANVAELRGALAADDSRLRAAEERVWPGMTHGCDAPDWLADELLWTRTQLAEARAEVERTNHVMRLERMARQDSEDRLKAQLAAAEAARDAVAKQALALRPRCEWRRLHERYKHSTNAELALAASHCSPESPCEDCRRWDALPTPSAALQRVRVEAAERALMEAWMNGPPIMFEGRASLGGRDRWVAARLAALFPVSVTSAATTTPDAGGK